MQTLKATNLVKSYKGRKVVDDVNLNALSLLLSSPPILKYSPVAPAATFKYPLVISTFPLVSMVNSGVLAPNVLDSATLIAKL